MKKRRFRSFAKINLGLEVVGRRPDGYHELRTLFASVSLHDVIEIVPARRGVTVKSDDPRVPDDESNLAHRAAVLMQGIARRTSGVRIEIQKRIPAGGGLGGGSSNAAAVLRALDLIWGLNLGSGGLVEAAKSLGADVPYFLVGGPALGVGRGDDIHPIAVRLTEKVLLIPGEGGLSTAAVFRRFAERDTGVGTRSRINALIRSIEGQGGRAEAKALGTLRNELEGPATEESPALRAVARRVRAAGRAAGAIQAGMSGSGSSFFLLFDGVEARRTASVALRRAGAPCVPCAFLSRKAYRNRFEIKTPR